MRHVRRLIPVLTLALWLGLGPCLTAPARACPNCKEAVAAQPSEVASMARGFGALIEAVNQVGSLFYGGMLGVFVLAFFVRRAGANGAFAGLLAGEAAIFAAAKFTNIAFLWYNVIGCVIVIAVGVAVSAFERRA